MSNVSLARDVVALQLADGRTPHEKRLNHLDRACATFVRSDLGVSGRTVRAKRGGRLVSHPGLAVIQVKCLTRARGGWSRMFESTPKRSLSCTTSR
jgi:hypothetical protein